MDISCNRCGRTADEDEFALTYVLVYEQGADFPYCPECIEEIKRTEGRVPVADAHVGAVWNPVARGEG